MDPFHANLLLLQCQRLSASPRPFDCAIRVTASSRGGNGGGNSAEESKAEHLLFAHCHILGTKSALLRAQLDQSQPTSCSQLLHRLLLLLHHQNDAELAQGLAAAGALNGELRELKLDLSTLLDQNAAGNEGVGPTFESFKQFVAFLYGEQPAAAAGPTLANQEQLLLLSKAFAVPDLEVALRSALLAQLLTSQIGQQQLQQSAETAIVVGPPSNSTGAVQMPGVPIIDANHLPVYAAYLQLQSLLGGGTTAPSNGGPLFPAASDLLAHQNAASNHNGVIGASSSPLFPNHQNHHLPFQQQQPLIAAASRPASESSPEQQIFQPMLNGNRRESASSGSSSIPSNDGPMGGAAPEMLVPSNDKEGWCRNKKYIQIVKKGYRCLLCNKIYGRYNSVSYHVTIYHRNPPIRCEEQGCQFTTREARYIHFHKYYRHQIALPESIDLASRKCPLIGCKHVSKSPAMLDKHVQRHVADCLKEGGLYVCQMGGAGGGGGGDGGGIDADEAGEMMGHGGGGGNQQCQFTANGHELMYTHLLACHSVNRGGGDVTMKSSEEDCHPLQMSAGEAESVVLMNKKKNSGGNGGRCVSASAPNTPPTHGGIIVGSSSSSSSSLAAARFHCEDCAFRGRTLSALEHHRMQKHRAAAANVNANGIVQRSNGQIMHHASNNHQLPPLPGFGPPAASLNGMVGTTTTAFNGLFGGLFPAAAFAAAAAASSSSLPGSPISPNGGGLFPTFPTSMDQQQQSAQQLLAQLFAAQKLASIMLASSPQQQQQQQSPPPPPSTNATIISTSTTTTTTAVNNENAGGGSIF